MEKLKEAAKARNTNPRLRVAVTDSEVGVDNPDIMKGKRVVTVDDGPTLTHGGMQFGAGKPTVSVWSQAPNQAKEEILDGSVVAHSITCRQAEHIQQSEQGF